MSYLHKKIIIVLFNFVIAIPSFTYVSAAAPLELEQAINEKTRALQEVTNQLQAVSKNLGETEERSRTLKQELTRVDYSLGQLNLGIKSSEFIIDKLELEISALQYDITDAQDKVLLKKKAVQSLLRVLQERDRESLLLSLMKNGTLGDILLETQTLVTLNGKLAENINELKNVQIILSTKLKERSQKREDLKRENGTLKIRKIALVDQKQDQQTLLSQTKNQQRLYEQQINELEKKQLTISGEIEEIEEELRSKIDPSLLPQKRAGVLLMPVKGFLSQNFGITAFSQKGGYRGKAHNGIDIAASIGTPIYAAEDGVVVKTGNQDLFCRKGAYGRFIVISHNNNLVTLYAHLSSINVNNGQTVTRGDFIGYVGKSGYATGPHLHLTVYSKPTFYMGRSRSCGEMPYGGYLNPLDYL